MREDIGKESLPSKVIRIGESVTADDVDTYVKIRDAEDRRYKLRSIVDSWDKQQSEDRKMRKGNALFFLILIAFQVVIINLYVILIGINVVGSNPLVLKVFFIPVLGEIVSMTFIILKYLFPKVSADILELIKKL